MKTRNVNNDVLQLIEVTDCYRYASNVLNGTQTAGIKVKQSATRFMNDLDRSFYDSSYRWAFDVTRAYRPITFMERFMAPTKGDYDAMNLLPWQHFVEGNLYGWVDKHTLYRRFREGLIIVGSGNGKSTLVTGNAAYMTSKDGERGAEVYCAANSKKQANIIFGECKTQIDSSPLLAKHFRTTEEGIYYDATNSKFEPLATETDNMQGFNVHLGIFDELQDFRTWQLINTIKAKGKKRKQPLFLYITTLGTVIDGPLMDLYVLGGQILEGSGAISERAADRMFIYIAEIDEKDDPDDVSCWIKANPSLGALLDLEDLIDEWERVKLVPSERSDFINKQLNIFTSVDELSFLDAPTIMKNKNTKPLDELKGQLCYGGFDLAESGDFVSACLEFPLPDNDFFLLEHSWVPLAKKKENHEKLDWDALERGGHLTIVDAEYVEFELVLNWFKTMRELYRIDSIGFDPAKAFLLVQALQKEGFILNAIRQGELTLTAPLDDLKERFLKGRIIHNNNPLYNWYLGNVKLTKRGPNATYLPTKQHRYRKIDGFAAHLIAHTEWLHKHPLVIPEEKKLVTVLKLNA